MDHVLRSIETALELARSASPLDALASAQAIAGHLSEALPALRSPHPAGRIVVPTTTETISITDATTGNPTAAIPIQWPRDGLVVGLTGTVLEGDELSSWLSAKLEIEGVQQLITTGVAGAYVPLSLLRHPGAGGRYLPLAWPVYSNQRWTVTYQCERAVMPAGETQDLTGQLAFLFVEGRVPSANR